MSLGWSDGVKEVIKEMKREMSWATSENLSFDSKVTLKSCQGAMFLLQLFVVLF